MMEKKKLSRSGMLLLELMASILIFSLAAAVCVQVFVKAHSLSADAQTLASGVAYCANTAEIFRAAESREKGLTLLREVYPQTQWDDRSASVAMGDNLLKIEWQGQDDGLEKYTIQYVDAKGNLIYELDLLCLYEEAVQ